MLTKFFSPTSNFKTQNQKLIILQQKRNNSNITMGHCDRFNGYRELEKKLMTDLLVKIQQQRQMVFILNNTNTHKIFFSYK